MLPTAGQLVPKERALALKAAERKEGEGGVWKECTQNEWTVSTNPNPNPHPHPHPNPNPNPNPSPNPHPNPNPTQVSTPVLSIDVGVIGPFEEGFLREEVKP